MKKLIPILFVFFLIYGIQSKEAILIPKDAIRFRVIANSNSIEDQELKLKVKESIEPEINKLMLEAKNSKEAKEIITNNLSFIRNEVNKITKENKVNFGKNFFPEKEYLGVKYEQGDYESLVITLGSGKGKNWWCVMFPPLCLIEAEKNTNSDQIEYKFLIKEILDRYQS